MPEAMPRTPAPAFPAPPPPGRPPGHAPGSHGSEGGPRPPSRPPPGRDPQPGPRRPPASPGPGGPGEGGRGWKGGARAGLGRTPREGRGAGTWGRPEGTRRPRYLLILCAKARRSAAAMAPRSLRRRRAHRPGRGHRRRLLDLGSRAGGAGPGGGGALPEAPGRSVLPLPARGRPSAATLLPGAGLGKLRLGRWGRRRAAPRLMPGLGGRGCGGGGRTPGEPLSAI